MIINLFTSLTNKKINEINDITIINLLIRCPPHDMKVYDFKHTSIRDADLSIYFDYINSVSIHKSGKHILITDNTKNQNIECFISNIDTIYCKTQCSMEYFSDFCSVSKLRFLGWTMTDKLNNGYFIPKSSITYYTFATNTNIELILKLAKDWPLEQKLSVYSKLNAIDNELLLDLIYIPNIDFFVDRTPTESIFIQLTEETFGYELLEEASTGSVLITKNTELSKGQFVWNSYDDLLSILRSEIIIEKKSQQSRDLFLDNQRTFLETFTKLFTKLFENIISNPLGNQKISPIYEIEPLVSIITPTYNRSRLFKIALFVWNSLTYKNKEWIIVDDGDEPLKIPQLDNIKHIKLEKRLSIGEKRNIAIKNSSGEFIMCMDDDDFYPPNVIEHRLATLFNSHCSYSSSIACYNWITSNSFINSPNIKDPPHKRVSEATLFFKRSFWMDRGFPTEPKLGEGEGFIEGRYHQCRELDWVGIIISLIHSDNVSHKTQPLQLTNGNHFINNTWGMSENFIKLLETI
jgi:hypothetical protein